MIPVIFHDDYDKRLTAVITRITNYFSFIIDTVQHQKLLQSRVSITLGGVSYRAAQCAAGNQFNEKCAHTAGESQTGLGCRANPPVAGLPCLIPPIMARSRQ